MKPPWPVAVYEVLGDSMLPTYSPGDFVLSWRLSKPQVGDVVVAKVEGRPVIKRLKQIDGRRLWLEGDNPAASTDSRHYGWVSQDQLVGRVVWRVPATSELRPVGERLASNSKQDGR